MAMTAVIDHQTIRVTYEFQPTGTDNTPVDIFFDLIHQYSTSDGAIKTIALQSQKVEAAYFQLAGLSGRSQLSQTVDIIFQNPPYVNGLFVQASGIRSGNQESSTVEVLLGDRTGDFQRGGELVSNPIRADDIQENTPVLNPVPIKDNTVPRDNIVVAEFPMQDILYDFTKPAALGSVQSGERWILQDNVFVESLINAPLINLMENSITNLIPNPAWQPGSAAPLNWQFAAPGFIIEPSAVAGPIPNTHLYRVTGSNPTWATSAFNNLKLRTTQAVPISYQSTYCFSIYVQSLTELPFSDFHITFDFFDAGNNSLGTVTKFAPRSMDYRTWTRYVGIFEPSDIPPTATSVKVIFATGEVGDGSYFVMEYYAPQLEENYVPTSFVLADRPQDVYRSSPLNIPPPYTILLDLPYLDVTGIRGLAEIAGIRFSLNKNYLQATVNGTTMSGNFVPVTGNVEVALYVTATTADLLVGRQSIANCILSSPQSLIGNMNIGGLLASNRTINSLLNTFQIVQGQLS